MAIKGYLFDYGGTIDTDGQHWGKVLWHAYEANKVPVDEQQFREAYVYAERTLGKNPIIQTDYTFHQLLEVKIRIEMEYLVERGYLCGDGFRIASYSSAVLDDIYQQVKATTAKNAEVLRTLSKQTPIVLVSNFYGNLNVVLEEFHLDEIFCSVVESAVVGVRKPNAKIYEMGLAALKLKPEEVMVVGDSFPKDILPARSLGCQTCWVKGEGWTDDEEDETIPNCIVQEIGELLNL